MMPTTRLDARTIGSLIAAPGRRITYRDTVVRGMYLDVHGDGKTFGCRGRLGKNGKLTRLTLGRWQPGVYDLADAREDAKEKLRLLRKGIDPRAEERAAREAGTLGKLIETYLSKEGPHLRPATLRSWRSLLLHERLAALRGRRILDITRSEILDVLDKIRDDSVAAGGKGYSSNRTMEAVRRVFNWALEEGLVETTPVIHIKKRIRELPRQVAYTDIELGAIARALDDSPMSDAIRLSLWTASASSRRSALLGRSSPCR